MNSAQNVTLSSRKKAKKISVQTKNVTLAKPSNKTEKLIRQLMEKSSNPQLIEEAFEFAKIAYKDKYMVSGENYIHHATRVASILDKMNLDPVTISFGFLHDVMDDKSNTI